MAKEKMMQRGFVGALALAGAVIVNKLNIGAAKSQIEGVSSGLHFVDRILNKADDKGLHVKNLDDVVHIYIDDEISAYYGITAKAVTKAFEKAENKDVVLHFNCAGGDVMQARAMIGAIVAHTGKVTALIDGLCASAATFIACACESVAMNDGGYFVIHNATGFCWGDFVDMQKQGELLEKITNTIADDYAAKTGGKQADMLELMNVETMMDANEALEAGFIDEIVETRNNSGHVDELKNKSKLPIAKNIVEIASNEPPIETIVNYNQLQAQAIARAAELSAIA
ncbi:MAG: Clp protease ClpP [Hyphomicrobiales bacterium]